jgi:hypothetical protein
MPIEPKIPFDAKPLIIIAGLLSLFYTVSGALVPFFLMMGDSRPRGWNNIEGICTLYSPLFAFPIFLSSLYSMKICRNCFTAYFIVDFLSTLIPAVQVSHLSILVTIPKLVITIAVVLLNAAYLQVRDAIRGSNEKIPGLINIMKR